MKHDFKRELDSYRAKQHEFRIVDVPPLQYLMIARDGRNAVRLETLREGTCVQVLHVGSYDDEAGILATMHDEFIPNQSLRMTGKHHEVYLSDARRTPPEKLRTILRQPVSP